MGRLSKLLTVLGTVVLIITTLSACSSTHGTCAAYAYNDTKQLAQ